METTFKAIIVITRRKGVRGKPFRTWITCAPITKGGFELASLALDWAIEYVSSRSSLNTDVKAVVSLSETDSHGKIISEDRAIWEMDTRRMDA
jgi:hypothetical protein